ncbi:hypothetical protein Sango_1628100 [Sesamum angolense]|uniref:Reverse transcriptase zinc-binding domain-containing protein n=1 Tax=Sesamum angolense TaxID=2727404 RepID=A0AAE1WKD8_9LAMI|nr:hypothetical protein Sango_1628100 [Sesamum angolense]
MKETMERVLASLENCITDAMHADLTRPFTSEEITQALNQMHPLKSSGLDDNVLVAYELNYFLMDKSWGRVGHVFLKLDIRKAYDRVEFCFLERVLFKLATQEASLRVKHILSQFEEALGLKINNLKLAMVFNKNMEVSSRAALAGILGFAVVAKHDKYLGLPTVMGHSKKEVFEGIKERIWKHSWSSIKLSQARRSVLLKSIIQTITTYVMSWFRLPDTFLREMEGSWSEFPDSNFFKARLGPSPCYTWRSLLASRDLLAAGLQWKIGDGSSVPIVGHPWLPRPQSFQLICRSVTLSKNTKVAAHINSNFEWNRALVEAEFSPLNAHCILGIKLWGNGLRDALVWHYESHGRFLVGSAYRVAYNLSKEVGGSTSVRSWRFIWSSKAPPKVLIFAWRWSRDAMPTSASLRRWGVRLIEGCFGCFADQEDVFHVHFSCPFARLV